MSNRDVDLGVNPLEDIDSEAAIAYQEQRYENIRSFVRTNSDYYIRNFDKIGASARFTATFNFMAGLFGAAVPLFLKRLDIDPAIGSTVILTTVTDVVGFLSFLGLATWILL
jgi:Mg/Co/Ni transporter MgtE